MERDRNSPVYNYPPQNQYYGPPPPGFQGPKKTFNLGEEDELYSPQFKTYVAPSARQMINPPPELPRPYKKPVNPRERPFLFNAGNASFSASIASFLVYPFIRMRELLSIQPDMSSAEKTRRYTVELRKILSFQGLSTLIKGYSFYAPMIPALTLDLALFYSLKKRMYPEQHYSELQVPWMGNMYTAGLAAMTRYMIYHPFQETYMKVNTYSAKLRPGEFMKEILRYLKYRFQTLGFGGVYEGIGRNLPLLMLFRGIQLGTCETMFQRLKYEQGYISWIRKFIFCWGITAVTKYLMYPFEVAKEKTFMTEPQAGKAVKNYFDALKRVFTQADMNTFRRATNRAFRASGSALTLSIFFHVTDETPKMGFA